MNETDLKVFVYNGQLDLMINTPGTNHFFFTFSSAHVKKLKVIEKIKSCVNLFIIGVLQWVEKMKWKKLNDWNKSKRTPLVVNGIIEGYRKIYDNFAFYWINRAGHMVI